MQRYGSLPARVAYFTIDRFRTGPIIVAENVRARIQEFQVGIGNGSLRSHVSHERPCLPFFHSVFPHYAACEIGAHSLFQRYQPANATGQNREIGLKSSPECRARAL